MHAHIHKLASNSTCGSWKNSVMEGADLVKGLLDDQEDVLVSSASRLALDSTVLDQLRCFLA